MNEIDIQRLMLMGYSEHEIEVVSKLRKLAEALAQGIIGFEMYFSEVDKLKKSVGW